MDAHLAQVNIARMKAPFDDPVMAGFVGRIRELNALADGSPGFVWRLPSGTEEDGYHRPYEDDRIPSIEEAKQRLAHLDEQGPSPVAFTFKQVFPPAAL